MSVSDPVTIAAAWLALALGAALLPGERHRRIAGAGLLTLGLGLAAWGAGSPAGAPLPTPSRLGQGFLVVNGGLLVLGAALMVGAAVSAKSGPLRPSARLATLAGAAVLAWRCAGFLAAAGPARALAAALGLGLGAAALLAAGRALASTRQARSLGRRFFPPPLEPTAPRRASSRPLWIVLAGAVAGALGPHMAVVFSGVIATAWAAHFAFHPPGRRPRPTAPALTLALVPAYWLLATVAGPVGLALRSVPDIPLSPAAELLVAPLMLLAGWAVAALWPLQRQLPGAILAPLGALLLARIALPLAPAGLEYWRPLLVPVVVLGLWHAAASGRWPLLAAGAGFLGVAAGGAAGAGGAPWLLAAGLALELAWMWSPRRAAALVGPAAWLAAAWGGLRVVEGGLRGEVVYTALGALGLALILAAPRGLAGASASRLVDFRPGAGPY